MAISIMLFHNHFVQRAWHLRVKTDLGFVWITIFQKLPKIYIRKGTLDLTMLERAGNPHYVLRQKGTAPASVRQSTWSVHVETRKYKSALGPVTKICKKALIFQALYKTKIRQEFIYIYKNHMVLQKNNF